VRFERDGKVNGTAHGTIVSPMGKLIYSTNTSLDGFIEDEDGNIDFGVPDPELFTFINDLERGTDTVLYGRLTYETMVYWETEGSSEDDSPFERDFAAKWRSQDKIVYSTTLEHVSSARTTIERSFVPDAIRALKKSSSSDLSISGPHLASQAIEAGLVDEMHLFVVPVTLGGGKAAHPGKERTDLTLLDARRFDGGTVQLHYRFNNAE
jgi:dihydrofolate reductase